MRTHPSCLLLLGVLVWPCHADPAAAPSAEPDQAARTVISDPKVRESDPPDPAPDPRRGRTVSSERAHAAPRATAPAAPAVIPVIVPQVNLPAPANTATAPASPATSTPASPR